MCTPYVLYSVLVYFQINYGLLLYIYDSQGYYVNLVKECEESNSPTHTIWTFSLHYNFFEQLWRKNEKALPFANSLHNNFSFIFDSKYYARDYSTLAAPQQTRHLLLAILSWED